MLLPIVIENGREPQRPDGVSVGHGPTVVGAALSGHELVEVPRYRRGDHPLRLVRKESGCALHNALRGGRAISTLPKGYRARVDEPIDSAHARPQGATDEHVAASGKFTEALAYLERARGHLYSFHRLVGEADAMLDEVIEHLRSTGNDVLAARVADELRGRNVIAGRWTFQVVEEFDDGYYAAFRDLECSVRNEIMAGRRHVYEAEMKQRRRTPQRPDHEATPDDTAHSPLSHDGADRGQPTPARQSLDAGS